MGRAEKKRKKTKTRGGAGSVVPKQVSPKELALTLPAPLVLIVYFWYRQTAFFFFASAVQPNLIPCCRANYYRAKEGNANEKEKNNNYYPDNK